MAVVQDADKPGEPISGEDLSDRVRLIYPQEASRLQDSLVSYLGVRRSLQWVVEQNLQFIATLRNDGLQLLEIAEVLTHFGLRAKNGGSLSEKSLQSAIARAISKKNSSGDRRSASAVEVEKPEDAALSAEFLQQTARYQVQVLRPFA